MSHTIKQLALSLTYSEEIRLRSWGRGLNRAVRHSRVPRGQLQCGVVMFQTLQPLKAGDISTRKVFCVCGHMFSVAVNKIAFYSTVNLFVLRLVCSAIDKSSSRYIFSDKIPQFHFFSV